MMGYLGSQEDLKIQCDHKTVFSLDVWDTKSVHSFVSRLELLCHLQVAGIQNFSLAFQQDTEFELLTSRRQISSSLVTS